MYRLSLSREGYRPFLDQKLQVSIVSLELTMSQKLLETKIRLHGKCCIRQKITLDLEISYSLQGTVSPVGRASRGDGLAAVSKRVPFVGGLDPKSLV